MDVRRKSARRRRQGKNGDADQKNVSASVVVAERTTDKKKRGEQEGISFDDPLHVHRSGFEICLQRRQRNVYDRPVDERHARCENGGGKDPAAPCFFTGRCSCARADYIFIAGISKKRPHLCEFSIRQMRCQESNTTSVRRVALKRRPDDP